MNSAPSFALSIICTVFCLINWFFTFQVWQFEWKANGDGTITSRKYGTYPAQVEFRRGMTLMPGQSARIEIGMTEKKDT